jgi:hypothetical protein
MRERDAQLLEARRQLSLDLVPAARGAVLQHLDAIVELARCTAESPQALLDLSDHLQALLDITRLFGVSNSHLRAAARQEMLKGNGAFDFQVLVQMPEVFAAARTAKASLEVGGQIGQQSRAELEKRLEIMKNLGPRLGKNTPKSGRNHSFLCWSGRTPSPYRALSFPADFLATHSAAE